MNSERVGIVRVIVNPTAGRGRGKGCAESIARVLEGAGIQHEVEFSRGPAHATQLALGAQARGSRAVVAVGGDGTASEVVNGLALAHSGTGAIGPLVVLPIGSGNDFAAITGSPREPSDLPRVLQDPRRQLLDLGTAKLQGPGLEELRYFDNTIGVGFEARVNRAAARIRRLRGVPLYLLAALRALRSPGAMALEIEWTDEAGEGHSVSGDFLMVTAGNGPRSGGGFFLTPEARHDSGTLELGLVETLSRRAILALLPKALKARHTTHPAVRIERCTGFRLCSTEPLSLHADGELLQAEPTAIEVAVVPGCLELWT